MKDIIDINKAKADIKALNEKFTKWGQEWESYDGNPINCYPIALKELIFVKNKANEYKGFICEYNESDYCNTQYNKWYESEEFTQEQFNDCEVDETNYGKADAVAFDLKCELVSYLEAEIKAQEKIQYIGTLCEIERYQTLCEFFDEEFAEKESELDTSIIDDIEEEKENLIEKILK